MKRMFGAALLAALAGGATAQAQFAPGCAPAVAANPGYTLTAAGGCGYFGCGGFCMRTFPHLNQHGPLYNYGPYYGYYPFAPYGPWDANLNYTGPAPGPVGCGWNGCLHGHDWGHWGGWWHGHGGGCASGNCGGWGHYSMSTFHNVFHRTHPLWNRGSVSTGCSACSK